MSWLSKLAFWRDDTPEIDHVEGYEVNGCFVPNEVEPDTKLLQEVEAEDTSFEIPDIGTLTQPESGPR